MAIEQLIIPVLKMDHNHSHHMHHHPVENVSTTTVMPAVHNHDDHSGHGAVSDGGAVANHALHHMMEMAVRFLISKKLSHELKLTHNVVFLVPRRLQ